MAHYQRPDHDVEHPVLPNGSLSFNDLEGTIPQAGNRSAAGGLVVAANEKLTELAVGLLGRSTVDREHMWELMCGEAFAGTGQCHRNQCRTRHVGMLDTCESFGRQQ